MKGWGFLVPSGVLWMLFPIGLRCRYEKLAYVEMMTASQSVHGAIRRWIGNTWPSAIAVDKRLTGRHSPWRKFVEDSSNCFEWLHELVTKPWLDDIVPIESTQLGIESKLK